jgi:hypothetical protein
METTRRNEPGALARRGVGLALVLAGLLTGCPDEPEPFTPWPEDYPGSLQLTRDPACKLTGGLVLTLGEGEWMDFNPLAPGQEPFLHHGPQGGTHLLLGVEVANPAREFPGLQLDFLAERQRCPADGDCLPFETMGRDRAVVMDSSNFQPREGDAVATSGALVIVSDWNPSERRRVRVVARDRCGRSGTTSLELGPQ